MTIGQKISELLSKENYTKVEVAKKLNISRITLSSYISEKTSIPVDKLKIIANIFKIDVKEFFEDKKANNYQIAIEKVKEKIKPKIVIQYELSEEDHEELMKKILNEI
jgi:transcriptional regulator with XRE-family HTH domain